MQRCLYTMSVRAHTNLQELFASQPTYNTQRRHVQEVIYDGFSASREAAVLDIKKEGISHALNTLPIWYDIQEWEDTRPNHVKEQHRTEYEEAIVKATDLDNPVFATIADAKEHYKYYSKVGYRAKWYKPFDKLFDKAINEEDDREWNELSLTDQYEREQHQLDRRHRYMIDLTPYSRSYYYMMAIIFGMDTLHPKAKGETAYVSACLEAIGLRYISPPDDYLEILHEHPNKKKIRLALQQSRNHTHRLYGNFEGTPFIPKSYRFVPVDQPHKCVQEDIQWLIDVLKVPDVAQIIVDKNPALVMPVKKG